MVVASIFVFRITKMRSRRAKPRRARRLSGIGFHVEHLLVDGQKMSKSLGNMYTVRDVIERGYTGRELRYALLSGANYAKNLNFTWQGMDDAKTALSRIDEWRKRVRAFIPALVATGSDDMSESPGVTTFLKELDEALAYDLNINDALGRLFLLIRETHKALDGGTLTPLQAQHLEFAWKKLDGVLGLGDATVSVPEDVQALLDQRAEARKMRDFAKSDELRKAIEALGWKVKDTAKGQELLPG